MERETARIAIAEVLVPLKLVNKVEDLERAIYNLTYYTCKGKETALGNISAPCNWQSHLYVSVYSSILYKVLWNIQTNAELADDVKNGKYQMAELVRLSSEELNREANKKEREEINMRLSQKIDLKVSTLWKCRKCGNNKTIPMEYQGRALDEASNHSIKCISCGFIWRT